MTLYYAGADLFGPPQHTRIRGVWKSPRRFGRAMHRWRRKHRLPTVLGPARALGLKKLAWLSVSQAVLDLSRVLMDAHRSTGNTGIFPKELS